MLHFKSAKKPHVTNIVRCENDPIVQNGLALTPARMLELNNQGFSISAQNSRILQEIKAGDFGRMDVLPEYRRGFDPLADGYQLQQEIHSKARHAIKNAPRQKKTVITEEGD